MATLYYNAAIDQNWSTLGNWWTDEYHSTPAASLPGSEDDVVLSFHCYGGIPTIANLTVKEPVEFYGIAGGQMTVTGTATFNNGAKNYAEISGAAVFNNNSRNSSGIVYGIATFNDVASNYAAIFGNATFNDESFNYGGVYGTGVNGNATFNDASRNIAGGSVQNNATFNDYSQNLGDVSGTVTLNGVVGCYEGIFYIVNTVTSLNCDGSGAWNGNFYTNGVVTGPIPSTIYVRTTGSDATGNATEANPLATAQHAFNAAAAATGNIMLDFGPGNFGGVVLSQDWPARISVRGAGASQSFLGGISSPVADAVWDWNSGTVLTEATSAFNATIVSNKTINLGNFSGVGGNGFYEWSQGASQGGDGGSLYLTDGICGSVLTQAGNGGDGQNSFVGGCGEVILADSECASIEAYGGDSIAYPSAVHFGVHGLVSLTDSSAGNITCRSGAYTSYGPFYGSISLLRSTAQTITGDGSDSFPGGTASNVTLTDSQAGAIASNGGTHTGSGAACTITLTRSECTSITCDGGENFDWYAASGGTVLLVDSTVNSVQSHGGIYNSYMASVTNGAPGNGGNVTIDGSTVGAVSCLGGITEPGRNYLGTSFVYAPPGTITLTGNTQIPPTLVGNLVTTNLRKGRGVNGSSILGIA